MPAGGITKHQTLTQTSAAIDPSPARRAHSSKPAARCCSCRRMGQTGGQTDGQTDGRADTVPLRRPCAHTMRVVSITNTERAVCSYFNGLESDRLLSPKFLGACLFHHSRESIHKIPDIAAPTLSLMTQTVVLL